MIKKKFKDSFVCACCKKKMKIGHQIGYVGDDWRCQFCWNNCGLGCMR